MSRPTADLYVEAETFFNGPGHGQMPQEVADYLGQTRPDLYNMMQAHLNECTETTEAILRGWMADANRKAK